jgi:hypothetical protein
LLSGGDSFTTSENIRNERPRQKDFVRGNVVGGDKRSFKETIDLAIELIRSSHKNSFSGDSPRLLQANQGVVVEHTPLLIGNKIQQDFLNLIPFNNADQHLGEGYICNEPQRKSRDSESG